MMLKRKAKCNMNKFSYMSFADRLISWLLEKIHPLKLKPAFQKHT